MPMHAQWEPDFAVGHQDIDAQHQELLSLCNGLAGLCQPDDDDGGLGRQFVQAFDRIKAVAREHFATEAALLAGLGDADLEDQQIESDEFEHLAAEIATTENFDRLELQRFLTLWWVGHITGSAARQRTLLAGTNPPA